MSQEIVEAVRALGREKGIAEEKLMAALEDALLSAYKKQPGSAQYARVEMDRESATSASRADHPRGARGAPARRGEEEAAADEQARVDPETGEVREPEEPEIPLERLEATRTRSRPATSRPTTSAASPRRPPSRSSCSASARPSAT